MSDTAVWGVGGLCVCGSLIHFGFANKPLLSGAHTFTQHFFRWCGGCGSKKTGLMNMLEALNTLVSMIHPSVVT